MLTMTAVESEAQIQQFITLSQDYVAWMIAEIRERFPEFDLAAFTADHAYDDVRKKYPGEHVPPHGRMIFAVNDGEPAGCIALAKLSDSICEMRTLYVKPAYRGTGIGKNLAQTIIADARQIGYTHMRLDTLKFMAGAQSLYRALGFTEIPPYTNVSDALKPYIRFFEVDLRE